MSPLALCLVLAAALLHASWNLVAKKAGGGNHFVLLGALFVAFLWAPAAVWVGVEAVARLGVREWAVLGLSAVLHVLYFRTLLHGYSVDMLLYANNYEPVDDDHPVVQRFDTPKQALAVFGQGRAMSKGTTTASGITSTYFANPFGAVQRREAHEAAAERVVAAAFQRGIVVGQLRTRLGIDEFAARGPRESAAALLRLISARHASPSDENAQERGRR